MPWDRGSSWPPACHFLGGLELDKGKDTCIFSAWFGNMTKIFLILNFKIYCKPLYFSQSVSILNDLKQN